MTEKQFNEITEWQEKTFPKATSISKLIHLAGEEPDGEIKELVDDIKANSPNKKSEWADCFFLLFGSAKLDGMSYQDIIDCIQKKFEVNKLREWQKPDKNGVVFHVK